MGIYISEEHNCMNFHMEEYFLSKFFQSDEFFQYRRKSNKIKEYHLKIGKHKMLYKKSLETLTDDFLNTFSAYF